MHLSEKTKVQKIFKIENTLPFILKPFIGESLFGYLLRLDFVNGFPPGSILDMLKKHNTGTYSLNRPGLFVIGTIFNLEKLSEMVLLPYKDIIKLTMQPLLKSFFCNENVYPRMAGYTKYFKICPLCIKEKKLNLIHLFNNIDICIEHNTPLLHNCECGNKIKLFSKCSEYYRCPYCRKFYQDIEINDYKIANYDFKRNIYLYDAYNSLLNGKILLFKEKYQLEKGFEDRLHYLCYQMGINPGEFKKLYGYDANNMRNGHGPVNISLSKILEILYGLGHSPKTFLELNPECNLGRIQSSPLSNTTTNIHSCPNIYCQCFDKNDGANIRLYGRRHDKYGKVLVE